MKKITILLAAMMLFAMAGNVFANDPPEEFPEHDPFSITITTGQSQTQYQNFTTAAGPYVYDMSFSGSTNTNPFKVHTATCYVDDEELISRDADEIGDGVQFNYTWQQTISDDGLHEAALEWDVTASRVGFSTTTFAGYYDE